MGTLAFSANARASCFRLNRRIVSDFGPKNAMPASSHMSTNSALSLRNPYPGCTALHLQGKDWYHAKVTFYCWYWHLQINAHVTAHVRDCHEFYAGKGSVQVQTAFAIPHRQQLFLANWLLVAYLVDLATSRSFLAFVYSLGEAPKQTASSPSFTCRDSASGSVKTTTVGIPSALADLMTRRVISPLLAMSSFAFDSTPVRTSYLCLRLVQDCDLCSGTTSTPAELAKKTVRAEVLV